MVVQGNDACGLIGRLIVQTYASPVTFYFVEIIRYIDLSIYVILYASLSFK